MPDTPETPEKSATLAQPQTGDTLVPVPVPPPPAEDMKKGRRWWLWVGAGLVVVAAGVLFATGIGGSVPVVPTEIATPGPADRVLIVAGRTQSENTSDLIAAVSGTVMNEPPPEGAAVEKGDTLVQLDDARARAALRQALAALDAAVLARQRAQEDNDRAQALGSVVSEVERSRAAEALQAAKLDVDRLSAALEQARLALEDYRIVAPFGGTILTRQVENGEFVQAGRAVMRLADLSKLYVAIEVDEDFAAAVKTGQEAVVQLAGRDESHKGRVSLVSPEVNAVTGAVPVRIAFESMPEAQVGLTAIANIVTARSAEALTVPRTALVQTASGSAVFVLREGKAVLAPIRFIDWPAERVEVTEGLAPGDVIVLAPDGLSDGMQVNATPAQSGAEG